MSAEMRRLRHFAEVYQARAEWKSRAEKAEAKVLAVEAECDRLARNRGGWDSDIAKLFRGVLRSTDEDGST